MTHSTRVPHLTLSPASNVGWFSPTYHRPHPKLQLRLAEKVLYPHGLDCRLLRMTSLQAKSLSYPTMHHLYFGAKDQISVLCLGIYHLL
jgi:hypothetical protein